MLFLTLAANLAFSGRAQPVSGAALDEPPVDAVRNYLPVSFNNVTPSSYGLVSGVIIDAVTGVKQAGVSVCVLNVHCVLADLNGKFYLSNVPTTGLQTLTVTPDPGLYSFYSQLIQVSNSTPLYVVVSLSSTNLSQGWVRIVLTWGNEGDLDANLLFGSTRIYYGNKGDCSVACLQSDSNTYGPETITVSSGVTDLIKFAVARQGSEHEITYYNALVQVYDNTGLLESFSTPSSGIGSVWYVFDMAWNAGTNHYDITKQDQLLNGLPH